MEVGSLREKILIALLIHKFGEENVDFELPITEPEVDVRIFDAPISIKTITIKTIAGLSGIKANWTVDAQSARNFVDEYQPKADILLAQIKWNDIGYLHSIPLEVQRTVIAELGKDKYFRLPKPGTNPRGIEFSKEAILRFQQYDEAKQIEIHWQRPAVELRPYEAYKRWVDYWGEE